MPQAEVEVSRLENLKARKGKDIVLKKKFELEELRRKTHLLPEDGEINFAFEAVEAGTVNNQSFCFLNQPLFKVLWIFHLLLGKKHNI